MCAQTDNNTVPSPRTCAFSRELPPRRRARRGRPETGPPSPAVHCRGSVPVGLFSRAAVRGFRHAVASCLSFYSSTCASTRAARRRCGSTRPVTARPDQTPGGWLHLAQTVNACPDHVAPTARESIETRPPRDATREPAACAAVRFLRSGGKRVQMRSAACRHRSLRIGCP